jgi:hypothetical protein
MCRGWSEMMVNKVDELDLFVMTTLESGIKIAW